MGEEALKYREVIDELGGLKEKEIKEVIDFIGYLKSKKKKKEAAQGNDEDELRSLFGTMSGPSDLADQHDHYIHGWEKE